MATRTAVLLHYKIQARISRRAGSVLTRTTNSIITRFNFLLYAAALMLCYERMRGISRAANESHLFAIHQTLLLQPARAR
mmetsp:Transcript_12711/g.38857  ORF Transcript_12711/g.38857 Transcript_12711/m.38857 type:complete len:80 (-) Transcript_12711:192-431(-)